MKQRVTFQRSSRSSQYVRYDRSEEKLHVFGYCGTEIVFRRDVIRVGRAGFGFWEFRRNNADAYFRPENARAFFRKLEVAPNPRSLTR